MIAVTHPGMIGDALWAVPCARALAERYQCRVDWWTSEIVRPAADLLGAQDFVRQVVIDPEYRIANGSCGVQPWHMPNADSPWHGYRAVHHLGLRETPTVPIPEYYCRLHNLPQLPNRFDLPEGYLPERTWVPGIPFVVLAAKGNTDYREMFREFCRRCSLPVVEVGAPGQAVGADTIDRTSYGFLEMAWLISRCKYFVGLMSAPLVVASGFDCVKIVPHDGIHWDMRHVIHTPRHHYVVGFDPGLILERIR